MKKVFATLAALLVLGVVSPVDAHHSKDCPGYVLYVPSDALTQTYPVYFAVNELNSGGYLWSFDLYAESNGQAGLQRHDGYCTTPGTTALTADTNIF